MATLTGTDDGPLRLCCAVLGALETMGYVQVSPIGATRADWRENRAEPCFSNVLYEEPIPHSFHPSPLYWKHLCICVHRTLGHSLRWLGMVVHAYNPSAQEAEARGF
jgi:hypothetical protein